MFGRLIFAVFALVALVAPLGGGAGASERVSADEMLAHVSAESSQSVGDHGCPNGSAPDCASPHTRVPDCSTGPAAACIAVTAVPPATTDLPLPRIGDETAPVFAHFGPLLPRAQPLFRPPRA